MAAAAYAALPATFRTHAGNLVIRVADFPPDDVLAEMGAEDPYQLTGLYDGVALTQQSVLDAPSLPPAVWLFRRPILDEWAERGDVALDRLVAHVLVHEVAHHYGFSDEDIAAIDAWWL
ncbi:MAG: metallopeptidase family protein [Pseudomonadota bacterium]